MGSNRHELCSSAITAENMHRQDKLEHMERSLCMLKVVDDNIWMPNAI